MLNTRFHISLLATEGREIVITGAAKKSNFLLMSDRHLN